MKITDLYTNQNSVSEIEILANDDAVKIVGGSGNCDPNPQNPPTPPFTPPSFPGGIVLLPVPCPPIVPTQKLISQ